MIEGQEAKGRIVTDVQASTPRAETAVELSADRYPL